MSNGLFALLLIPFILNLPYCHVLILHLWCKNFPLGLINLFSLWLDWLLITYLGLVAAATTLICVCSRVGNGHQSAQVTHVNLIRIWRLEQTFSQELSRSVSNLTVTLHLAKPKTTITGKQTGESDRQVVDRSTGCQTDRSHSPGSSLHWLPVEDLDGTTGPGVDLVVHHVFQTLVIGRTDEDLWC